MKRVASYPDFIRVVPLRVKRGLYINYSYIVLNTSTNEAALIDPAWELETITETLRHLSAKLTDILVTHSHPDHVDLVFPLAERFGARVTVSANGTLDFPSGVAAHLLDDETSFTAASLEVRPLLTPGHTSDSICYLIGKKLFSGDTLFAEGCGLCSYETSDPSQLFRSLMRLKRELNHSVRIFPGHSFGCIPGMTFSAVMDTNIYLHFDSAENFVAFRTRPGQPEVVEFR
jgi:hydroxyacylglutathione hydrolase